MTTYINAFKSGFLPETNQKVDLIHPENISIRTDSFVIKYAFNASRTFNVTVSANSKKLDSAVKCFQRGWDDVINGRTRPISELWDDLDVK